LAVLLGPAEKYVIPLQLGAGVSLNRCFLSPLSFGFALRSSVLINGFISRRASEHFFPAIDFLHLSYLAALFVPALIYLDQFSLWHFDRYIVFSHSACPARYDTACFGESKDFSYFFDSF
jgi:hypothetical protein